MNVGCVGVVQRNPKSLFICLCINCPDCPDALWEGRTLNYSLCVAL